ncbi:ABC transporter substrate-binding protein [Conexibacter stalactiti]|uniref:ABC transporter substrate-binding protein n=1 Tax=Conexibacter stalactiti TaxID=1940611 RepID=A0ABU4HL94_9ACTN|nr:ABC transporter substrate-binding protein [Conexibacter stalactiti]MDW5594042.1 ABC transporter substrate-binding protein [Conexibacter stalactiti]MEC5034684.1 ABC transporter substrate-binding protein [Conexibacter stalactiti]
MVRIEGRPLPAFAARLGALLALCVAVVALAACGSSSDDGGGGGASTSAEGVTTLKVGVVPNSDIAPLYVGIRQGFFREQDLEIEPQPASAGAAIVPAVVSGQYQFGYGSIIPLLTATARGLPLQAVAAGNQEAQDERDAFIAVLAKKGSDIRTLTDLAGRKVGVNAVRSISDLGIRGALRAQGATLESDISYVEVPGPDMAAALESGRVDAVVVAEPFMTVQRDVTQVVSKPIWEATPGGTVGLYYTTEQYAADNPEIVERFRTAMNRSLEYAEANPDAARAAVVDYARMERAVADAILLPRWSTDLNAASVEATAALMEEFGFADDVDASRLLGD